MTLHTLRYELLANARNKRARLFTLGFPVLLLVTLSAASGDATTTVGGVTTSLPRFFLPGVMTMAVVTSCFAGMVQVIVTRRQLGVYQRRRATPLPARVLIAAQTLATTAVALVAATVLLVVAKGAFGVGLGAGPLVAAALAVVLGALALCAVAFLVASLVGTPETAQPVVQLAMFPVLFVSGIWFSADDMPSGLRAVADALPVKHLSDALHQAAGASSFAGAIAPGHLAVLGAWGAGAAVLASRRFAWPPEAATT